MFRCASLSCWNNLSHGYLYKKTKGIKHIPTNTIKHSVNTFPRSQNSSVCTATGYGLDGRNLILGRGKNLFFTPRSPDRIRGPPSPPFKWNRRLLRRRPRGWGVKLTTHLHIVLTSRMCGAAAPFSHTSSWPGAEATLLFEITITTWRGPDISVSKLMTVMLYLRFSPRWRGWLGLLSPDVWRRVWNAYVLLGTCLAYSSKLKMKVVCSSETPVKFCWTTRRHIQG
jgi:hypothetical protein